MNVRTVLAELGLSEGEITVYLALLKLGSSPVSSIKEETNLHRTTIYDFVERLLNRGLINYVVRNNVKYYNATEPQKLVEFLKEKQDHLQQILPELTALTTFRKEEVKVEVYKGKEGLKTVMLDCIRTAEHSDKEVVGIGIDDGLWKKALPVFIEQYQRLLKEKNIHERILTKMNAEYYFNPQQTHYKHLPAELFSPTSTLAYGDKVQIVIWEPSLTTLLVKNRKLAEAYRKHFNALWQQESLIFRGIEEVKAIFLEITKTMTAKNGQEYLAFGIPPSSDKWTDFFEQECMIPFQEHNVKTRVIFDERAQRQINACRRYSTIKVKTLGPDYMSPAEVSIYGEKVAIILWSKDPQAFVIQNKEIAHSFRKYFEVLWKMASKEESKIPPKAF